MTQPSIAFALGGLGGFNAHGVGFLKASLDRGVEPQLISCSSGQIFWTWRYLMQKNNEPDPFTGAKVNIQTELEHEIAKTNRFPKSLSWLDAPAMMMSGDPGVFSPAVQDYWKNMFRPYIAEDFEQYWSRFGDELLNRVMPAQMFVPERPVEELQEIGRRIALESQIGIIFNAFDAPNGEEILFINRRAQTLLNDKKPGRYEDGSLHNDTRIRLLDPNDPQQLQDAIDGALWLYLYGFKGRDGQQRTVLDGAYHRQFIIRELAPAADKIYSVRPQSTEWKANMPTNTLQVSNLVTQLWFNASYSGEVAHIALINELLRKEHLPKQHYRSVELLPIEYENPIRIYDYFIERQSVFDDAYDHSCQAFDLLT